MQRSPSNTPFLLRVLALCSAAVALLAADSAVAAANTARCRTLTRQIDHYENVAEMAKSRGDREWLNGTVAHIQRLSDRRERLCPTEDPNYALMMAKWFGETAKAAGKAFLKYLTFGAY